MTASDVVLLAAGQGERLAQGRPKALVTLGGRPLFLHSLEVLAGHPRVARIVLVVPMDPRGADEVRNAVPPELAAKIIARVEGGVRRQDSVRHGLESLRLKGVERSGLVLVHDSARPHVSAALIDRCLDALERGSLASAGEAPSNGEHPDVLPGIRTASWGRGPAGVVPGLPVRETLKLVYGGRVVMTQPREQLYAVQTPQGFRFGPLWEAHERAHQRGHAVTDDAALLEWLGMTVEVVPGDGDNLKITYPEDLVLAERLLAPRS